MKAKNPRPTTITKMYGANAWGAGKPITGSEGRTVRVYLDAKALAAADKLGDGNVGAGIRAALAHRCKR